MKEVRDLGICIIDDGVNEGVFGTDVLTDIEITRTLKVRKRAKPHCDVANHASICAGIIRQYAQEAPLHSVKILNIKDRAEAEQLAAAICWCTDNGMRVLNMSLGTTNYRDFKIVREAASYARKKGAIIVAAGNNKGRLAYPSGLWDVIGVKCDREERLKQGEYMYNSLSYDGVEVVACGRHSLTDCRGKTLKLSRSNSFTAPYITALVYNILKENPEMGLEDIRRELIRGSRESLSMDARGLYWNNTSWIERAVYIRLDGGVRPIESDLQFDIVEVLQADICSYKSLLEKINILAMAADTFVLAAGNDNGRKTAAKLMKHICSLGKSLAYIDEHSPVGLLKDIESSAAVKFWHPGLGRNRAIAGYKKSSIDVPVIFVQAESETRVADILLKLSRSFMDDGYSALAVTGSPAGVLSGLEYISGNVDEGDLLERLMALNHIYAPDVLLLGSLEAAEGIVVPDIRIMYHDGSMEAQERFVSAKTPESEVVVLSEAGIVLPSTNVAAVFCITDEFLTEKLYKHLLGLLEESNIAVR